MTPHQRRLDYATALGERRHAAAGVDGVARTRHPGDDIRHATLATPTLRGAYDEAMGKMRRQLTLTPVKRPIVPDKVSWLSSEMLKTRFAHGPLLTPRIQGSCAYADICETCDNHTAGEFQKALTDQLADIQVLQADA